ncbi:hypothetical protein M3Y95_01094200 [Aphelenchoides besseyi]|nr:hypothetical protein M3Y95_01094200 [Aphelenchoides besseyi]
MAQPQIVQLNPGAQVERWVIRKKLGEGGFGAVFKVSDPSGEYAMKVEGVHEQIQVLKMEVMVLADLNKRADQGRFANFNYVVMTLVGRSLHDLRKESPSQTLSMGTSISCGIQCLEALEDLHGLGYVHRDVKPGNYAIGRSELNEQRKVYILDFGMCRKFTDDYGVIRKPRLAAAFRGTVRYAPLACHYQRELARKDDLESCVYMVIEMATASLPWRTIQDINEVGAYKKRCRQEAHSKELFGRMPPEFVGIMQSIDSLKYYDTPKYQTLYVLMRRALITSGVQEFP